MIEEFEEVKEITWENIWSYWKNCGNVYDSQLMLSFNVKKIFVNYNNEGYFHGYDWIDKSTFQKRVEYVATRPI